MIKQTTLSTLLFLSLLIFSACKKGNKEESATATTGNTGDAGSGIYKTDENGLTLHENNRVISINLGAERYKAFVDTRGGRITDEIVPEVIYKRFKDDFDFIALLLKQQKQPGGWPAGLMNSVQNHVKNIGQREVNSSKRYGSDGKLLGILTLPVISYLRVGPSLHEIFHLWGNYLIKDLDYPNFPTLGPHWGVTGGNVRGQLGGFVQSSLNRTAVMDEWVVSSFLPQTVGGNSGPYNELELYLMGFIPLDQVTPFDSFKGISNLRRGQRNDIAFVSTSKTRYTPEKIRSEFGVRTPLPNEAQKDFKMLVVVLTPKPLTEKQWENIDKQSELFGKAGDDGDPNLFNFWEATKGMGTMETGNLHKSLR